MWGKKGGPTRIVQKKVSFVVVYVVVSGVVVSFELLPVVADDDRSLVHWGPRGRIIVLIFYFVANAYKCTLRSVVHLNLPSQKLALFWNSLC